MSSGNIEEEFQLVSLTLDNLQQSLKCTICLEMFTNPTKTRCRHTFCKECLDRLIKGNTKPQCPLCNAAVTRRNIKPDEKVTEFVDIYKKLIKAIESDSGINIESYVQVGRSTKEAVLHSPRYRKLAEGTNLLQGNSPGVSDERIEEPSDDFLASLAGPEESESQINREIERDKEIAEPNSKRFIKCYKPKRQVVKDPDSSLFVVKDTHKVTEWLQRNDMRTDSCSTLTSADLEPSSCLGVLPNDTQDETLLSISQREERSGPKKVNLSLSFIGEEEEEQQVQPEKDNQVTKKHSENKFFNKKNENTKSGPAVFKIPTDDPYTFISSQKTPPKRKSRRGRPSKSKIQTGRANAKSNSLKIGKTTVDIPDSCNMTVNNTFDKFVLGSKTGKKSSDVEENKEIYLFSTPDSLPSPDILNSESDEEWTAGKTKKKKKVTHPVAGPSNVTGKRRSSRSSRNSKNSDRLSFQEKSKLEEESLLKKLADVEDHNLLTSSQVDREQKLSEKNVNIPEAQLSSKAKSWEDIQSDPQILKKKGVSFSTDNQYIYNQNQEDSEFDATVTQNSNEQMIAIGTNTFIPKSNGANSKMLSIQDTESDIVQSLSPNKNASVTSDNKLISPGWSRMPQLQKDLKSRPSMKSLNISGGFSNSRQTHSGVNEASEDTTVASSDPIISEFQSEHEHGRKLNESKADESDAHKDKHEQSHNLAHIEAISSPNRNKSVIDAKISENQFCDNVANLSQISTAPITHFPTPVKSDANVFNNIISKLESVSSDENSDESSFCGNDTLQNIGKAIRCLSSQVSNKPTSDSENSDVNNAKEGDAVIDFVSSTPQLHIDNDFVESTQPEELPCDVTDILLKRAMNANQSCDKLNAMETMPSSKQEHPQNQVDISTKQYEDFMNNLDISGTRKEQTSQEKLKSPPLNFNISLSVVPDNASALLQNETSVPEADNPLNRKTFSLHANTQDLQSLSANKDSTQAQLAAVAKKAKRSHVSTSGLSVQKQMLVDSTTQTSDMKPTGKPTCTVQFSIGDEIREHFFPLNTQDHVFPSNANQPFTIKFSCSIEFGGGSMSATAPHVTTSVQTSQLQKDQPNNHSNEVRNVDDNGEASGESQLIPLLPIQTLTQHSNRDTVQKPTGPPEERLSVKQLDLCSQSTVKLPDVIQSSNVNTSDQRRSCHVTPIIVSRSGTPVQEKIYSLPEASTSCNQAEKLNSTSHSKDKECETISKEQEINTLDIDVENTPETQFQNKTLTEDLFSNNEVQGMNSDSQISNREQSGTSSSLFKVSSKEAKSMKDKQHVSEDVSESLLDDCTYTVCQAFDRDVHGKNSNNSGEIIKPLVSNKRGSVRRLNFPSDNSIVGESDVVKPQGGFKRIRKISSSDSEGEASVGSHRSSKKSCTSESPVRVSSLPKKNQVPEENFDSEEFMKNVMAKIDADLEEEEIPETEFSQSPPPKRHKVKCSETPYSDEDDEVIEIDDDEDDVMSKGMFSQGDDEPIVITANSKSDTQKIIQDNLKNVLEGNQHLQVYGGKIDEVAKISLEGDSVNFNSTPDDFVEATPTRIRERTKSEMNTPNERVALKSPAHLGSGARTSADKENETIDEKAGQQEANVKSFMSRLSTKRLGTSPVSIVNKSPISAGMLRRHITPLHPAKDVSDLNVSHSEITKMKTAIPIRTPPSKIPVFIAQETTPVKTAKFATPERKSTASKLSLSKTARESPAQLAAANISHDMPKNKSQEDSDATVLPVELKTKLLPNANSLETKYPQHIPEPDGVQNCVSNKDEKLLKPDSMSEETEAMDSKVPSDYVLACSGFNPKIIGKIKNACSMLGMKFVDQFTPMVTHLIVKMHPNQMTDKTLKYLQAVASGKWVLSLAWLQACTQAGSIVAEHPFETLDPQGDIGPKRSRISKQGLFANFEFCCFGTFEGVSPTDLKDLILVTGGIIVDSPEKFSRVNKRYKVILAERDEDLEQKYYAWFKNYKALPVAHSWLIESIATYKLLSAVSSLLCTITEEELAAANFPADMLVSDDEEEEEDEDELDI